VHSPQGMGFTGALGCPGSCKLDLLQCAVDVVLELEDSCLSRELQTGATAVGCSSGTEDGSSCLSEELQTWSTAVAVESVLEGQVRCVVKDKSFSSRPFDRYSCLCFERVPDSCRPILVT